MRLEEIALFLTAYIIENNKKLCDEYMGKYPVIFMSPKGVDGLTFEKARGMLAQLIMEEADRHYYLKSSDRLTDEDRLIFRY